MPLVGPNDPCLCDSGKKYKKCYGVYPQANTCPLFLEEVYSENIEYLQGFIDGVGNELCKSLELLGGQNSETLRSQAILAFSYMETMAQIWSAFSDSEAESDSNKFEAWYNLFAKNERNENFSQNICFSRISGRDFHKIRSELMHNMSLPNYTIGIVSDMDHSSSQKLIKAGLRIFSPKILGYLILDGSLLMLEEMERIGQIDRFKYLQGINRLVQRIGKSGASMITAN